MSPSDQEELRWYLSSFVERVRFVWRKSWLRRWMVGLLRRGLPDVVGMRRSGGAYVVGFERAGAAELVGLGAACRPDRRLRWDDGMRT